MGIDSPTAIGKTQGRLVRAPQMVRAAATANLNGSGTGRTPSYGGGVADHRNWIQANQSPGFHRKECGAMAAVTPIAMASLRHSARAANHRTPIPGVSLESSANDHRPGQAKSPHGDAAQQDLDVAQGNVAHDVGQRSGDAEEEEGQGGRHGHQGPTPDRHDQRADDRQLEQPLEPGQGQGRRRNRTHPRMPVNRGRPCGSLPFPSPGSTTILGSPRSRPPRRSRAVTGVRSGGPQARSRSPGPPLLPGSRA